MSAFGNYSRAWAEAASALSNAALIAAKAYSKSIDAAVFIQMEQHEWIKKQREISLDV